MKRYESYIEGRKSLLDLLDHGTVYYHAQYHEAKIVVNVSFINLVDGNPGVFLCIHESIFMVHTRKCHTIKDRCTGAVFPLGRFFSANQRFVGARANNFWQYGKHSFRKLNKILEI